MEWQLNDQQVLVKNANPLQNNTISQWPTVLSTSISWVSTRSLLRAGGAFGTIACTALPALGAATQAASITCRITPCSKYLPNKSAQCNKEMQAHHIVPTLHSRVRTGPANGVHHPPNRYREAVNHRIVRLSCRATDLHAHAKQTRCHPERNSPPVVNGCKRPNHRSVGKLRARQLERLLHPFGFEQWGSPCE